MRHQCSLKLENPEETFYPSLPPYASTWKKFGRQLTLSVVIDPENYYSKQMFRSQARISLEMERQIIGYPTTIHPFSKFCTYREYIMTLIFAISLWYDAFFIVFYIQYRGNDIFKIIIDTICFLDIISQFFIGYLDEVKNLVILDRKLITQRYLTTYFLCDISNNILALYSTKADVVRILIVLPTILKFWRIFTIMDYIKRILRRFDLRRNIIELINLIILLYYINHWFACVICLIPKFHYYLVYPLNSSWLYEAGVIGDEENVFPSITCGYAYCFQMGLSCFTSSASLHFYKVKLPVEMAVFSFIELFGYVFLAFLMAHMLELFMSINANETRYEEEKFYLEKFIRAKNLPKHLKKRLHQGYQYKFYQISFFDESITQNLSSHVVNEMEEYNYNKYLITKQVVFETTPVNAIKKMIQYFKRRVYLPNEIVFRFEGDIPANPVIYFISHGNFAFYVKQIEIWHYRDGDQIGLSVIFLKKEHLESTDFSIKLVCVETSEVFTIKYADFKICFQDYPETFRELLRMAKNNFEFWIQRYQIKATEAETKARESEDRSSSLVRGLSKFFIKPKPKKST